MEFLSTFWKLHLDSSQEKESWNCMTRVHYSEVHVIQLDFYVNLELRQNFLHRLTLITINYDQIMMIECVRMNF